ncbi:MAG: hypothetical protein H7326_02540 [Bdellovibrionaceae bacterium]|nr:hypothetical protein [Pseudobdellovibrionaceae bacterium]
MKKLVSTVVLISFLNPFIASISFAQDKPESKGESKAESKSETKKSVTIPAKDKDDDILKGLDYPELQVVPRATDRLLMEAQNEREYGWLAFWPYQVSSIATILSGNRLRGNYTNENNTDELRKASDNVGMAAMAVGISGLGLSVFLIRMDLYRDGFRGVKTVKVTDKRSDLLRERLAEESLEKPAHLINMLTTVSVATNLIANIAVATQANGDVRAFAAVGVLASFLPWMFENRYVDNWQKQQEYKRKIYTPLVGYDLQFQPKTASLQPQLTMNWMF